MDVRLNVKVDQFNAAMRGMQSALSRTVTMQQIIDFEVGRVLDATLKKMKAATKASIVLSIDRRGPWRTYDLGRGKKKYFLENRYPDPLWAKIQERLSASLSRKLAARGLAKQSVLALADAMGVKIQAPAYVQSAKTDGHSTATNAIVKRSSGPGKYTLYIEDNYPLLQWADGQRAFFAALAGRIKYIQRNLQLGVFKDLEQVAKRFPGLIVTTV